ncbi:MAG: hypothetical protein MUP85_06585 [Candidatus Lokiarchaeota archaeon]|nr:hypothetical protein [Candidatus Lokiarchaeota archaeon]
MTPIPSAVPIELLEKNIPQLLEYIVAGKVTKEVLDWARRRVRELWDKKEYGFTPEPEVAYGIQKIGKSDAFKRMRECIGNHPYLTLIKLSIRIQELSEKGNRESVYNLKNEVYKKYGLEGIRILTMGTTGVIFSIIQHLSNIKIENDFDQSYMLAVLDKIIQNWTQITIFHKVEDGQEKRDEKIISFMDNHLELFFVFSIGTASDQAKKAIALLNTKGTIHEKGYMLSLNSKRVDMIGREYYSWVFRSLDS